MEEHERCERIAELARQIWEAEGRPDGQSTRHWLMAERLLEAELKAAAGKEPRR
jgi:hypothetical protein